MHYKALLSEPDPLIKSPALSIRPQILCLSAHETGRLWLTILPGFPLYAVGNWIRQMKHFCVTSYKHVNKQTAVPFILEPLPSRHFLALSEVFPGCWGNITVPQVCVEHMSSSLVNWWKTFPVDHGSQVPVRYKRAWNRKTANEVEWQKSSFPVGSTSLLDFPEGLFPLQTFWLATAGILMMAQFN